jgi:integrase
MGKGVERLTAKQVENFHKPGRYPDGKGLYLDVAIGGSKQWTYIYWITDKALPRGGRNRQMGLGAYPEMGLAEAREERVRQYRLRLEGEDPIEYRKNEKRKREAERARDKTFRECAEQWLVDHAPKWCAKVAALHARQLEIYVYPKFGSLLIPDVEVAQVLEVMKPLYRANRPEAADKIRGRIKGVIDWAIAHKIYKGENPASWTVLKHALPYPNEIRQPKKRSSLPYQEMPDYYQRLLRDAIDGHYQPHRRGGNRVRDPLGSLALRWTIFTGVRAEEAVGAKWSEIDGDLWTIPAARMKGRKAKKREHEVPLSTEALAILKEAEKFKRGDYIFPADGKNGYLHYTTVLNVAKRVYDPTYIPYSKKEPRTGGAIPITTHGFRSTCVTYLADETDTPREVREYILHHKVESDTGERYQRSTLLQKRARALQLWTDFVTGAATGEKVVQLRKR